MTNNTNSIPEAWLDDGKASLLPLQISADFRDYLNTLPWVGSGLDWSRLQPFATINISQASVDELLAWTNSTALGGHSHMALCFSPKEPCLLVKREDGIRRLDELFWRSPGIRFCFGVDVGADEPRSDFGALLQYGAGDLLFAKTRPS